MCYPKLTTPSSQDRRVDAATSPTPPRCVQSNYAI